MGVGGIGHRNDADEAIAIGYDLVSVGKAYLVEPKWATKMMNNEEVQDFADINEQKALRIPSPLWKVMDFMIVDRAEEERKYER